MLTPAYIFDATNGVQKLAEDIHNEAIRKIVQRIMSRLADNQFYLTSTDAWQLQSLQELGYVLDDLQKEIAKYTGVMESMIQQAIIDAGTQTLVYDDALYRSVGLNPIRLKEDPHMVRVLNRNYKKTLGTWKNFTGTMPNYGQDAYIKACDKAYALASSGTTSYTDAVHTAINDLADNGVLYVNYTNSRDTIETATLRAVRTGIAQTSGDVVMERLEEMDWDIILVSYRMGARYGDGGQNPSNHAWWQGKFYSKSGNSKKFPPFSVTGYGTGEGLCGWNCRHSFGAGDGEHNPYSEENFDTAENKKQYDLSQKQRAIERNIRKRRRKMIATEELIRYFQKANNIVERDKMIAKYNKQADSLFNIYEKYNDFCSNNNLHPYYERLDVGHWDNSLDRTINLII